MARIPKSISLLMLVILCACATPYGSSGLTGGYTEKELEPGIWRITYGGNGFTTRETVQTFWLYRAAELSLEKGYDGFEIISPIQMISVPVSPDGQARLYPAQVFIPLYIPEAPKPEMIADIRVLKGPIKQAPPKVFDAADLKERLQQYVKGKLCDAGNVCPHVHHYLMPVMPPPLMPMMPPSSSGDQA